MGEMPYMCRKTGKVLKWEYDFNTYNLLQSDEKRAVFHPFTPFSLPFHFSFIPKDICFGLQNTVFWLAKHGLSEGESLAFASETYIFRK